MNVSTLRPGIYRVRIKEGSATIRFNLSVVLELGVLGVAAFNGDKPPRKGKHLLVNYSVRDWIDQMEMEEQAT